MAKWLRSLVFREKDFKTHINTFCISWDNLPNPTSEKRETGRVNCIAHRIIARNILGKWLLRRRYAKGISSVGSLTEDGKVLEIYPPLKEIFGGL